MQKKYTKMKININSKIKMLSVASSILLLIGCAGNRTADPAAMNNHLNQSNFQAIAAQYLKDGKPNFDRENLIDALEAGKAFNDAGMWAQSRDAFDVAHKHLPWKEDSVDTPGEVMNLVGTTLTSSAFGKYQGKIYEGGLISYYQSINALMLGEESDARVEFNRFDERMENAKTQFAAYVKSIKEENNKSLAGDVAPSAQQSMSSISQEINIGKAELPNRPQNAKVTNAAGQFMSGAFKVTSSNNYDKDANLIGRSFKEAVSAASTREGSRLASSAMQQFASKKTVPKGKVFVLYEDGTGPTFTEFRVDLPLFLLTDKVTYSGIALPKFVPGKPAFGKLNLGGKTNTAEMTNITWLAGMDFDVAYPGIVTKAITSTVIKTAAQVAANAAIDNEVEDQFMGNLLKLGVGVAQAATTQADVRAWANLPNSIQVAVIDKPSTNLLSVNASSGEKLLEVKLPDAENVMVLIKASGSGGVPTAYVKGLPVKPEPQQVQVAQK